MSRNRSTQLLLRAALASVREIDGVPGEETAISADGNGFTTASFTWLADLESDNTTTWFHEHREDYRRLVELPFVELLEDVAGRLRGTAVALQGGRATTFRINRDVRFSADKSPYNTTRSGLLTRDGTKAESCGLVYVQLDATGGLVAAGLYKPPTARLEPLRQSMVEDPDAFSRMVFELQAAGHELDRSEVVKTMPRGYAEHADHPLAEHLRLKQLVVNRELPRSCWLDDTVAERIAEFAVSVAPLLAFVAQHPDER